MAITASQVNDLRKRTGISMMACKKALEEAGGDEEKAIEILRKKGAAKAASKADRETSEGLVLTKMEGDKAAIVKLSCETDFVAKNEDFIAVANKALDTALSSDADAAKTEADPAIKELFTRLGENMAIEIELVEGEGVGEYAHTNGRLGAVVKLTSKDDEKARDIAMHITAMNPAVTKPEDISEELVAKEKDIWKAQLEADNKPAEIMDKIMMGKERKFREESALMKQSFVKDGEKTVEQYLDGNSVVSFVRMSV